MTCGRSREPRERLDRFRFNPYETAICGGDPERRHALVARLVEGPLRSLRVAQARLRSEEEPPDESHGVQCSDIGGRRWVTYASDDDTILPPRALVGADAVLISSDVPIDCPHMNYVGSSVAESQGNVLAWLSPRAVCPVLPPNTIYFPDDDIDGIGAHILDHWGRRAASLPLNGLVLAGGASTRMGHDKSAIAYHGKPQAVHAYELLCECCDTVYLSTRAEGPHYDGLRELHDTVLGAGPMGGILTAFRKEPNAAWLVLACDLPYVDAQAIRTLVVNRNPFKLATAFRSEHGFPDPLCTIYEPKSMLRMMEFFALGYTCPRKVLINSDPEVLEPPSSDVLTNVNRPDEAEQAMRRLQAPG